MGRGTWRVTVHVVAKRQTRLSDFHFQLFFSGLGEEGRESVPF